MNMVETLAREGEGFRIVFVSHKKSARLPSIFHTVYDVSHYVLYTKAAVAVICQHPWLLSKILCCCLDKFCRRRDFVPIRTHAVVGCIFPTCSNSSMEVKLILGFP